MLALILAKSVGFMSLSPKIYSDKIFYYEEVLPNPEEIVALLEETDNQLDSNSFLSKWQEWTSSEGDYHFGYRKLVDQNRLFDNPGALAEAYLKIKKTIEAALKNYSSLIGVPEGEESDIGFSKYLPDKYMGPHTDQGPKSHISAVMYLNDNFSGGELEFPNQNVSIKPSSGSIIVFPSVEPYVHDPKPATGTKYIVPAFWYLENSPLILAQV